MVCHTLKHIQDWSTSLYLHAMTRVQPPPLTTHGDHRDHLLLTALLVFPCPFQPLSTQQFQGLFGKSHPDVVFPLLKTLCWVFISLSVKTKVLSLPGRPQTPTALSWLLLGSSHTGSLSILETPNVFSL